MARQVSVRQLQAMQRSSKRGPAAAGLTDDEQSGDDGFVIDQAAEDAESAEMLRRIGAPPATDEPAAEEHVAKILADKHARGLHAGLTVGGCPACEVIEPKPEDQAEPTAEEAIAAAEGLPLYGDAHDDVIAARGQDDPSGDGPGEPQPDAMTRLVARGMGELNVAAECSEEMSLGMVIDRVRAAVIETDWGKLATDAEIVAEAERIFSEFSVNRKGPRQYDVVDGTVRDWRRPDTTPDRGDVTTVHTITDDPEGQRFSGAGADPFDSQARSGQAGQQASLLLVPSDAAFAGRQYRDAPELANIAERLISEHGFLSALVNCDVRWYWKRKTGVSKGRVKIGFMKRASDLLGHFSGADFIGWLSATTARDGKFTDTQIEAAVFHQLCHIGSDDSGNWIFAPHDFEGFAAEVRVFGTWTSDLKLGGNAFVAAHQMGLFADEDDDESDEDEREAAGKPGYVETLDGALHPPMRDGAGTLIHADGTPLTDDEIEAMERHEERGEEEDDEYPRDSDLRCERCGEPMLVESAEHDAQLAARRASGQPLLDICERCGEEVVDAPADPDEDYVEDDEEGIEITATSGDLDDLARVTGPLPDRDL